MDKSILIVCETGISAALLVSKMLENVREHKLDYDIDYAPVSRLEEKISGKDYDVFFITPQVARYQEKISAAIQAATGTIVYIQPEDFQYMNVEKMLSSIAE